MKIFIIVIALVSAVLANPVDDTQKSSKYQLPDELPVEFKEFAFKNGEIVLEEETVKSKHLDDDENYVTYRLPNNTRPVRYDLWVKTDVEKEDFNFTGRVKIHIRAEEDTDYVTLNYRETVIDSIDLLDVETSQVVSSNLVFAFLLPYDREFLQITLPAVVNNGSEFILDITYHGELHVADDSGFYRASYRDEETDELVWYATTKFEPHHARHLFPCYDEPQIRAPIGLEVQHDYRYHTFSNMPLLTRTQLENSDYVLSKFNDTPSMQTYLLAFLVSAFEYKSNEAQDIEQRIFAKPQSIRDGSADFAASISDEILKKFEEILHVPYMLPKLDHAAITEFPSGAMENFGFITYREIGLLLFTNYTEAQNYTYTKYIARLLAHEITHQWFGNTVSPQWWTYLWLNEGFATFLQYYVNHKLYPELGFDEDYRTAAIQASLINDVITNSGSVPMDYYVEEQTAIRGRFNYVSYQKAGSIIGMFQETLGEEIFFKGLEKYLKANYYQAASPAELYESMQEAYDEAVPNGNLDIASLMGSWATQAGYPIVSIEKVGSKLKLSQTRYPSGNGEIYSVPLTFSTASKIDFANKAAGHWLKTPNEEVEFETLNYSDGDWIILNNQQVGFYRVSYSDELWKAIAKGLQSNHSQIHLINRRILHEELNIGIRVLDKVAGSTVLSMLNALKTEDSYLVWNDANVNFQLLNTTLFGTNAYDDYMNFIQSLTKEIIDEIGYEGTDSESSEIANLRARVKLLNCYAFDESCIHHELDKLIKYHQNEEENATPDFCSAFRHANQTIMDHYLTELVSNPNLKNRNLIARTIHCSLNETYLGLVVSAVDETTNILTSAERINLINNMLISSPSGFKVAFEYINRNVDKFNSFRSRLVTIINTVEKSNELKALVDKAIEEEIVTGEEADELIAEVDKNLKWQEKHLEGIKEWLENNSEETVTTTTEGASSIFISFTLICASVILNSW